MAPGLPPYGSSEDRSGRNRPAGHGGGAASALWRDPGSGETPTASAASVQLLPERESTDDQYPSIWLGK